MMDTTEEALDHYGLDEWTLTSSSEGAMVAALDSAYQDEEPIIITAWQPHWKFNAYDLKFLEDPEEVVTVENDVHTLVRNGLEEDLPDVHQFLDQFQFELDEQQEVMEMMDVDEMAAEDAARTWLEDHPERVEEWTDGVGEGDGEEVRFVLEAWSDAQAATNMAAVMLEDLGYTPHLNEVAVNMMYGGLATDSADALLAAWYPNQTPLFEEFDGDFEDLGPNSVGAVTGVAVPTYMDIDSFEELQDE
ncbi:glycine betaine ABC transport system, glycine betaine-binding protein OpuAC [Geomicrobium sp. JCM 19037]|nr:glycine betaine ABC transporter substrate-binding protein [Geomicrobium sp. JCM 19037]GAK02125.1 glycine betaine ABC transport system, glycine betaine-binding protein OpuAC [Geomicrobium sp. JCM 19037]